MKKLWMLATLILVFLCGCVYKPPSSAKVFSNAQVHYQLNESHSLARKRDMAMPSYFTSIDYEKNQILLSKLQEKQLEAIFKKLIYPEEYKLYVSFGLDQNDAIGSLSPVIKRAEVIKSKYSGRLKNIQIAYIKNQKPNTAYFRLIT